MQKTAAQSSDKKGFYLTKINTKTGIGEPRKERLKHYEHE
jgi:hypothetical protein